MLSVLVARAVVARRAAPALAILAAALLLLGCGGPRVIVTTPVPADVALRPTHDGAGNELPQTGPFIELGQAPIKWRVPEDLLGGRAYVRAVFADGNERQAFIWLPKTPKSKDTRVQIAPAGGLGR